MFQYMYAINGFKSIISSLKTALLAWNPHGRKLWRNFSILPVRPAAIRTLQKALWTRSMLLLDRTFLWQPQCSELPRKYREKLVDVTRTLWYGLVQIIGPLKGWDGKENRKYKTEVQFSIKGAGRPEVLTPENRFCPRHCAKLIS